MLKVYDFTGSGNGYKVWLLMSQLGIPFERIECDILKGETRTDAFLALNPFGQVPVVQFDDGRTLSQSNAIILHFAEGSDLVPADAFERGGGEGDGRGKPMKRLAAESGMNERTIRDQIAKLKLADKPIDLKDVSWGKGTKKTA